MSQQNVAILTLPLLLAGTVVANRFVTSAGAQTAADGNALGVTRSAGVSGDRITVDAKGTAMIEVGAAVTLGATIKSDAQGRAIPWATSGARLAIALEAATAAGQIIECVLVDNAA